MVLIKQFWLTKTQLKILKFNIKMPFLYWILKFLILKNGPFLPFRYTLDKKAKVGQSCKNLKSSLCTETMTENRI